MTYSIQQDNQQEKRNFERKSIVRRCKVCLPGRPSASSGETTNASESGCLIRIGRDRDLSVGDEVRVAVAWDGQGVIRDEDLVTAHIRRVVPIDHHHQAVGLEYAWTRSMSRAA